jgi:uncharacterized protein YxeA
MIEENLTVTAKSKKSLKTKIKSYESKGHTLLLSFYMEFPDGSEDYIAIMKKEVG